MPVSDYLRRVAAGISGSTSGDAAQRVVRNGPNVLAAAPMAGIVCRFARPFASPLIILLLGAVVVALSVVDWLDAAIGTVQEASAVSNTQSIGRLIAGRRGSGAMQDHRDRGRDHLDRRYRRGRRDDRRLRDVAARRDADRRKSGQLLDTVALGGVGYATALLDALGLAAVTEITKFAAGRASATH